MPEETEFKTLVEEFEENLKEQRQERKEESGFLKMASLSTAIIAVILPSHPKNRRNKVNN